MPREGADRFKMAHGTENNAQQPDPGCHFLYEVLSYQIKMSGQCGKLGIVNF